METWQDQAGTEVLWELSEILSLLPEHHWKEKEGARHSNISTSFFKAIVNLMPNIMKDVIIVH